jgi:hypothetical protein
MPEPGLSEIVNMQVDPERATGTPAVVYDNRELMRAVNDNAQMRAHRQHQRYNMFLNNLKDIYKDLGEIAKQPIMTEDRPVIQTKMAEIFKEISRDPQGYFGGGAKFAELQGKISELQSSTTESKQNNLFDAAHSEFFYRNPELATDENRAVIDEFRKKKLGQREPYQLRLPGLFDPVAISKVVNGLVKEDFTEAKITPDEQFIETTKGIRFNPDKYNKLADTFYMLPDARGIQLRETLKKRFDSLPDELKSNYKDQPDPVKSWYIDLMDQYRSRDELNTEIKHNPNWKNPQELALEKFKAQSGRISANASMMRAQKYGQLADKKLNELDDTQKTTKGFWDGVVDRVRRHQVRQDPKGDPITGNYIYAGDLPASYKNMGGVGADGKPIALEPFKTGKGVAYYKTRIMDTTGKELSADELFKMYKSSGTKMSYDDAIRTLIKRGSLDLEVIGNTKNANNEDVPAVANFDTAEQVARALNNKNNQKGDEPIFPYEENPQ